MSTFIRCKCNYNPLLLEIMKDIGVAVDLIAKEAIQVQLILWFIMPRYKKYQNFFVDFNDKFY